MTARDIRSVDTTTNSAKRVDYAHHKVHNGDHFFYTEKNELDNAATRDLILTVADTAKWPHVIFTIDGLFVTQVDLYETTTHTVTAPTYTVINNNRNSATTAGMTIDVSNADGADGTLIYTWKSGTSSGTGPGRVIQSGRTRGDQEIVLKRNTKYLLRITSTTDDNLTNTYISWYEHTNETM